MGAARHAPGGVSYARVACNVCGYNLTGVAIGGVCPECGAGVDQSLYSAGRVVTNGKAVTALVMGILSITLIMCCFVSPVLGIIGLIFGSLALKETSTGNFSSGSRGMAIAGLICSGIGALVSTLFLMLAFLN
ncbi:MAG: DUF4190 domain-containing protein [Phycisphaeraceae bacterium]